MSCAPLSPALGLVPRAPLAAPCTVAGHRAVSTGAATAWAAGRWPAIGVASVVYVLLLRLPTPAAPRVSSAVVVGWNAALAVFSCVGSAATAAAMAQKVAANGLVASVCDDASWFHRDEMGVALLLFVLSKPCELGDTALLKLRGRPVPFLHWYHHITVMGYTWHAYVTRTSLGAWFATLNYAVHSIMYTYYALTQLPRFRARVAPIAPLITIAQIVQMLLGLLVCAVAMRTPGCRAHRANTALAIGIYASYAVLFVRFFFQRRRRTRTLAKGAD